MGWSVRWEGGRGWGGDGFEGKSVGDDNNKNPKPKQETRTKNNSRNLIFQNELLFPRLNELLFPRLLVFPLLNGTIPDLLLLPLTQRLVDDAHPLVTMVCRQGTERPRLPYRW